MKLNPTQVGLAGEYYVLAQLTARGMVATLTLGNTKGVDILVTNQELNKLFKVEVKTSTRKPGRSKYFGDGRFYAWAMNEKHERILDINLFYCFVYIRDAITLPKFFLVPSMDVADYVSEQHKYWLKVSGGKDTLMRQFRIHEADPHNYENNWLIFS